jgi:glycosyltransferase involved in cell wall biosynthesis
MDVSTFLPKRKIKRFVSDWLGSGGANTRLKRSFVESPQEEAFVAFVASTLDEAEYRRTNPDVAAAGADPIYHWLKYGIWEGRGLAPHLYVQVFDKSSDSVLNTPHRQSFVWKNKTVVVSETRHLSASTGTAASSNESIARMAANPKELEFIDFARKHFDRENYCSTYPDIGRSGIDPLSHWLEHGVFEGRMFAPGIKVATGDAAKGALDAYWSKFFWRGVSVAFRQKYLGASAVRQIMQQAQFESAVLAPGARCIDSIREFDAPDIMSRAGVAPKNIYQAVAERPDVVVCTPFLLAGGAEKYVADIVGMLSKQGRKRVLVLVTDQTQEQAAGWEELEILAPLLDVQTLHWPEISGPGHANMHIFARFLNSIRAGTLIVNNSRIALDAVARYGRGLSVNTKIFCTYFSHGLNGLGAPYGARYPYRTMAFSSTLTDNEPMARLLAGMWGPLSEHKILTLSAQVTPAEDNVFRKRADGRLKRFSHAFRTRKWAWISRVEPFKGTAILAELSGKRPRDEFHVFGPLQESLEQQSLAQPNVKYQGVIADMNNVDLSAYDGFIFTSRFEGMPNVVLEISQHALPMVLTDVGGLKDTFSDTAALFVSHEENDAGTASRFSEKLEELSSMTPSEVAEMISLAREQALAKHSPDAYAHAVNTIFGEGK